jgi:hypothetical protein
MLNIAKYDNYNSIIVGIEKSCPKSDRDISIEKLMVHSRINKSYF